MTNLEKWFYYLSDLESPNSYIEWCFYSLISTALNRHVWIGDKASRLFTNLFVLLVGPPACGKSRAIGFVDEMLKSEGLTILNKHNNEMIPMFNLAPDTSSRESLLHDLAKATTTFAYQGAINGKPFEMTELYSSMTFLIEELGVLFGKNTENIVNMFNKLYDGRDYKYKVLSRKEDNIKTPYVNILAATNPDFIKSSIDASIISQGFTSRLILIYEDQPRFRRLHTGYTELQLQAYQDVIKHIRNVAKIAGEVKMSPEAYEWYKTFYETGEMHKLRCNKDYRLDDYYGRKNIHVQKLATILLFADQTESFVIQLHHMQLAYQILTKIEARMHEPFEFGGVNLTYMAAQGIKAFVDGQPQGVSVKRLWFYFFKNVPDKKSFEEAMQFLIITNQLRREGEMVHSVKLLPTLGEAIAV